MLVLHSPRIRGDGPPPALKKTHDSGFSPYSRGWSSGERSSILAVQHSPRIRGDGPSFATSSLVLASFSPYSRGWSWYRYCQPCFGTILPVFAGMVPVSPMRIRPSADSPRIRGDGPPRFLQPLIHSIFSPYSRGWSQIMSESGGNPGILPVFAGMVPIG